MDREVDSPDSLPGLVLVSCVAGKRESPAPAKDLYVSNLFCKVRAYVELMGQPWFILSAQYGLVHPNTVIEPYDCTLNEMRMASRRRWASEVLLQLAPQLEAVASVTFFAGQRYREFLEQPLRTRGLTVEVPMRGLKIGEQLRWLNQGLNG